MRNLRFVGVLILTAIWFHASANVCRAGAQPLPEIVAPTETQAREYTLDPAYYKKSILIQNILIATSQNVSDYALRETAYLFDKVMNDARPDVAERVRQRKVLCLIVGHDELVSNLPQYHSKLVGKELDFYNWRNRGFLEMDKNGHPTVLFPEEDVLEYEGGMRLESVLIHEFGHVIEGAGFDKDLETKLNDAYQHAKSHGLYRDGYAAQRFERVKSTTPVNLLDALVKSFPAQKREFLKACLDGGDILVNGKPTDSNAEVTKSDKVLIVFGGPKNCYALLNKAEYWAEGVECWYDCNRVMDHDHNHIHTREGIKAYDPDLARVLAEALGDHDWRFVSPRLRAGKAHLAGFDPEKSPKVVPPDFIDEAAQDYYDEYWKSYWSRLHEKHPG
ncbi:MAG TPA: hypothetical protein VFE47_20205 [Tepidisphaeraceae bacterium]|jgi:hypothetical protein|nr:hypothetical protein [Tepidisphaeraceae bacterium]